MRPNSFDSKKAPRAERIAVLRHQVAKLERGQRGRSGAYLPLGMAEVEAHLPDPGLACGILHEVVAAAHGDRPAAFGFVFALMAAALQSRRGPAIFIANRRALADFGEPYGHGLAQLGLDPDRLLLVAARTDKDALWAIEDTLRSQAVPAMVAGTIAGAPDLSTGRRLNLAAATTGSPLVLLRPSIDMGASAAATRWRIAAAPAARDRFGTFARWRWRVALERCRNGRIGEWLIEWDHVAHRFRLVEVVADSAPVARAGLRRVG